jgi:hypothetical protein
VLQRVCYRRWPLKFLFASSERRKKVTLEFNLFSKFQNKIFRWNVGSLYKIREINKGKAGVGREGKREVEKGREEKGRKG